MRKDRDIFGQARCDGMFDLIHDTAGKASTEDIIKAGKKREQKVIERIGYRSEKHFTELAKCAGKIISARNANPLDDVYNGIDKWVTLRDDQGLPEMPVQIKSSDKQARLYKYGDSQIGLKPNRCFKRLHGMEIVLNCGASVSLSDFNNQLRDEVRRIKVALKADPTLLRYIRH